MPRWCHYCRIMEWHLLWEASSPDISTLSYQLSATIDFAVASAEDKKMTSAVAEAVVTLRQN